MVVPFGLPLSNCFKGLEDLGEVVHIDLVVDAAIVEQHLECLKTFLLQLLLFVENQRLQSLLLVFCHGLPGVEAVTEQALAPLLNKVADFYLVSLCLKFLQFVNHQFI